MFGEMGFEPLKRFGEPDAANSRSGLITVGWKLCGRVRCTVSEVAGFSRLRVGEGRLRPWASLSMSWARQTRPHRGRPCRARASGTGGSRAPA